MFDSRRELLLSAALAASIALLLDRWLRRRGRGTGKDALARELARLEARAEAIREALAGLDEPPQREVRIWMDGAFDMMHYGHANAFRKGRALGTHLIVGVNDDESILRCKGAPPLMNDEERLAMVQACKFVDEVVPKVPYIMSPEYLRWAIETYRIDYVVHGDDPCIVDGRDVYESARALGKYRTIPRTEGVSTTEIVGRMLLLTRDHHRAAAPSPVGPAAGGRAREARTAGEGGEGGEGVERPLRESKFLPTSTMYRLFADGCGAPPAGARVVYVDGGWDMFHAGHVAFLREAAALGDFLLVGVHSDAVVNRHRGCNFPLLNQQERVLSVLACRHTGDVVIDPPWYLTREMIAALDIAVVAHGTTQDRNMDDRDPYEVPRQMGIFSTIPSKHALTVDAIVGRIHANHDRIATKVEKKMVAEQQYYNERYRL